MRIIAGKEGYELETEQAKAFIAALARTWPPLEDIARRGVAFLRSRTSGPKAHCHDLGDKASSDLSLVAYTKLSRRPAGVRRSVVAPI